MARTLCPAKVNLFLAVGPVDGRGYHPLRTIFQAISLADELEVEWNVAEPGFFCDDPVVPAENTVTKTLRLLSEIVALPPLRITLTKHVPAESGLGGGSSDAAGLLRIVGLRFSLPTAELAGIAAAVGADVPFFLMGGTARAEGYGERLTALPDRPTEWLVIARPPVGCPTGPAYRALDALSYEWRDFPSSDLLYNDFERVAPCESIELTERLQVHGARDAALSGSGSAVFGRFADENAARLAANFVQEEGLGQTWVCRTLSRVESLTIL